MENTLLRLVQSKPERKPRPPVGRGTSGIVLFAKTAQAAAKLSADWNTPRIQKIYWRWLKTLHSTTPTKSSHPSALYRTRASDRCGRQPEWQAVKVIGEGDLTRAKRHGVKRNHVKQCTILHDRHHNI